MNQISLDTISNFQEPLLERSFLFGLMRFHDSLEATEVLIKAKKTIFSSEGRVSIFESILSLSDRNIKPTIETVVTEARKKNKKIEAEFLEIFKVDPMPNLEYINGRLNQLAKDKRIFLALYEQLEAMAELKSSEQVLQDIGYFVDDEISKDDEDVETYAEIKEKVLSKPIEPKYPTGLAALDRTLKGGVELGQMIIFLGDPDAGKSMFTLQMLREFAKGDKPNCKAGAFPFEFSKENFAKNLMENDRDKYFNHDFLLLNDRAEDIHKLKSASITMIRRGAKIIVYDSQMKITDETHQGSLESMETKKFKMLEGLARRYNILVVVIAQRSKEGKGYDIFGSKLAGHIAHLVFDMTLPDPDDKLHPTLKILKNKQNGITGVELPLKFNREKLEYRFIDKGKEGKVGRKPKDGNDAYEGLAGYPIIIEDENGNTLDMPLI